MNYLNRKSISGGRKSLLQFASGSATASRLSLGTDAAISRYMDGHNKTISKLLGFEEKQNFLSRYIRLRNKTGLNYLKPELDELRGELE